jgi:hypothetical protein
MLYYRGAKAGPTIFYNLPVAYEEVFVVGKIPFDLHIDINGLLNAVLGSEQLK